MSPAPSASVMVLEALRIGQRPFLAEPGAPGLTQVMDGAEPERGAHGLRLLDIALDGPERLVVGPVRLAGTKLIEGHDPVALVHEPGVAVAQIVAGEPRPPVDAEQHLVAGAEAVGDDVVAVHGDVDGLVRRAIVHHGLRLPSHGGRRECFTFAMHLQAGRAARGGEAVPRWHSGGLGRPVLLAYPSPYAPHGRATVAGGRAPDRRRRRCRG